MAFTPSPYQRAVFDFVREGRGSAQIIAVAGAGKTTTSLKALELIPAGQYATYLAFNKKIVVDTERKLAERNEDGTPAFDIRCRLKVATFHSVGFNAWRFARKSVREPDPNKLRDLMSRNFGDDDVAAYGSFAVRMVGLARNAGVGVIAPDDAAFWMSLSDHYDVYPDVDGADTAVGIEIARKLLRLSVAAADATPSHIDYDDMLYMPLLRNIRFFQVDWLFVDEEQDTNQVQLALMRRMLKPGGRHVGIGDPSQAIYGFRGADSNAMTSVRDAFGCVELPLTVSYRCPRAVVELARSVPGCGHIEASPSAPEGEVVHLPAKEVVWRNDDVIICRNTAPLVSMAYSFIARGVGCKVLGREIGAGLVKLVRKLKTPDVDEMLTRLDAYAARETARFLARGQEQKAEAVEDRCACIRAIVDMLGEDERSVDTLTSRIEGMFSDDAGNSILTLCTVHKSKGLEWDRVFILESGLMPSKWARQAWQLEQEHNLMYVAYTRAKHSLIFLQ